MSRQASIGPLIDVRVIELGRFIAGPYGGQLLADLGADVVKVEHPDGGDPFRSTGADTATAGYASPFLAYNRNKRSVALDMREEDGRTAVRRLIETADVLIENHRPGVMERLMLDYERIRVLNPRLIYCSISGFGSSGPEAQQPSYDTIGQARSGMLGELLDAEHPMIVGPAFSDGITGLTAAYAILAALHARSRTGLGQRVEVPMLAATTAFLSAEAVEQLRSEDASDRVQRPARSQAHALRCADGRIIAVHLSSPEKFWRALLRAIAREDLAEDPRFCSYESRVANHQQLAQELSLEFARRSSRDWLAVLAANDVPCAPVQRLDEVFADEQARHLGLELTTHHPDRGAVRTVAPAPRFSATPWGGLAAPPLLGEDTERVLAELDQAGADGRPPAGSQAPDAARPARSFPSPKLRKEPPSDAHTHRDR